MASDYLLNLRELRTHYAALGKLAAAGDWSAVTTQAPSGKALFQSLQRSSSTSLSADERLEARQLLNEILDADRALRALTSAWLDDARPLIAAFNRQR